MGVKIWSNGYIIYNEVTVFFWEQSVVIDIRTGKCLVQRFVLSATNRMRKMSAKPSR